MPTYRLDIRYDGSGFHGYAAQPGTRTVQGELEAALFHHTGDVKTSVAGRTDAGVHALGQVVSFSVDKELAVLRVVKSLNKQLGGEVVIAAMTRVADDFDARFAAIGRVYRYSIQNGAPPDPLLRRYAWHVRHELSLTAMNEAAGHLTGLHDFASFCRHAPRRSTERTVHSAAWSRESGGLVRFDIEASSFCHQMVRSIVALCVFIGRGKESPDVVPEILAAADRASAVGAAPPHGLTLMSVIYP